VHDSSYHCLGIIDDGVARAECLDPDHCDALSTGTELCINL
jgi:hypothetical protein